MSKASLIKSLLKILIFIFLILVPILVFSFSDLSNGNSIDITFQNSSTSTISNLKIYENSQGYNLIKDVPSIPSNETLSINVNLTENFTKGSIILSYKDNTKIERKIILIDHIEKGSFHKIDIKINGINKDGILLLDKEYQNII